MVPVARSPPPRTIIKSFISFSIKTDNLLPAQPCQGFQCLRGVRICQLEGIENGQSEAEIIENGYKQAKPDVTFASFVREYELTEDDITVYLDNPSSIHYDYLYKKGVPYFVLEKIDDNIAGEFNRDFTVYDFSEKLGFHAQR